MEDRLTHSNEQCTTKGLKEYDASRADGNVFNIKDGLNSQKRYLEAHTRPYTGKELVAKPFSKGCIDIEGRNKPRTNSEGDAAKNEEGCVVANDCHQPASYNWGDDIGQNEWENVNAWFCRGDALYTLEIEWEVKYEDEECTAKQKGKARCGSNGALREDPNGESGVFAELYLTVNEQENKTAESHE